MAMEMHVFYRGKLPSRTALNKAMKELGLPLVIIEAEKPLERQTGFMPMRWRRHATGVEFDVWTEAADIAGIGAEGVNSELDRSANFRWTGDFKELLCAQSVAAALAKLVGGAVFDPQEGQLLSPDEAIANAHSTLALVVADALRHKRAGASSTDIAHLLRPLLEMRRDLLLRGHHLFIRPVRHLLRGAHLAATANDTIRVSRRVAPLYETRGYGKSVATIKVWQPDFVPWMIDVLREDVFDHVGQLTSLSDFVDDIASRERQPFAGWGGEMEARIVACVLAGERDRAEACIAEREGKWHRSWIDEQRAFLDRDISSVCEEYHAREARHAQALDLGDAWEPTPFPVEIPKPQRGSTTSETPWATEPWVATPPGIVSEPPEAGQIAFARDWSPRKGGIVMVAPLTCEQAQAVHDNYESYSLFSRLAGGKLLVLSRETRYSPHDPEQSAHKPSPESKLEYCLRIHSPAATLRADFTGEGRGNLDLLRISILDRDDNEVWAATSSLHLFALSNQITIWEGTAKGRDEPVSDEVQRAICASTAPPFGSYADLLVRTSRFLRLCGYDAAGDWSFTPD